MGGGAGGGAGGTAGGDRAGEDVGSSDKGVDGGDRGAPGLPGCDVLIVVPGEVEGKRNQKKCITIRKYCI